MDKTYSVTGFNYPKFLEENDAKSYRPKLYAATGIEPATTSITFHFSEDLTGAEVTALDADVAAHDPSASPQYRILALVNEEFKGIPIENIDFARHMGGAKALNKKTTMSLNGRPEKAEYYDGADLISEIQFEFTANADNLVTDRKEWLYQYRDDGTKSDAILIKHKIYDHTDIADGAFVMKERVDSRTSIIDAVKATVSAVLMAGGLTLDQVIATITPFWDETQVDREHFIEFGSQDWKNTLAAVDLNTTPHTYLAAVIDGNGTTVRDYMVSRLDY